MNKQYGLILKRKGQTLAAPKRTNVFHDELEDDDDDSPTEEEPAGPPAKNGSKLVGPARPTALAQATPVQTADRQSADQQAAVEPADPPLDELPACEFTANKMKKETKLCIAKALAEDPNVFAYDELFDQMQTEREEAKQSRVRGESKYVQNLIRSAEARKVEEQRRTDRMIEKERQEEGDQFDDKETFVTEAYKQKLQERKLFEEAEKREQQLEEIMDVRKQADMGGFYRHLLNQQTGEEKLGGGTKQALLKKIAEDLKEKKRQEEEQAKVDALEPVQFKRKGKLAGKLRRQSTSGEESEPEEKPAEVVSREGKKSSEAKRKPTKRRRTKENAADEEDNSESSENSSDEYVLDMAQAAKERKGGQAGKSADPAADEDEDEDDQSEDERDDEEEDDEPEEDEQEEEPKKEEKPESPPRKPRRPLREIVAELFEKKCVGDRFLEEQRKYFERLALENSGA